MNIIIITPAPPGSRNGNRVTALRWARLLRRLGYRVTVLQQYQNERCDLLVALHARRSFAAVERFQRAQPDAPVVVALTGTDLYDEIRRDPTAQQALHVASRLVVLQGLGIKELPQRFRAKARVIYQSAEAPRSGRRSEASVAFPRSRRNAREGRNPRGPFQVCVLGHLRPVKDPFRTAEAARLLPASSQLRVLHVGAALTPEMAQQARAEAEVNPRYRWLGDLPHWKALRVLSRSHLLVLTSLMEGGANVVSEAIAASVPVLSSRIPGSMGILGAAYPGFFPVGKTRALAELLHRAETDAGFYKTLSRWCRRLRPLFRPCREQQSWRRLLGELQIRPAAVTAHIRVARKGRDEG
jgi:putative glycosyltransferase (TIGR04348 family)